MFENNRRRRVLMSIRKICVYPDPVLRQETENIENFDESLKAILEDMWDTMYSYDGIGLAAPQIGLPQKIVVVDYNGERYALINPEILESEGSVVSEEGCLSFPGIYEKVESPEKIRIRYQDADGVMHDEEVDGFLARVFCHETDHLKGRLLIDRVSPLKRRFMKKKIAKRAKEVEKGE
jgi:peptide deformylase